MDKEDPKPKKKAITGKQERRKPVGKKSAPGGARRSFPSITIGKALAVAQKLKELNGGNPWAPESIATALDVGAKSPKFFYITAASRDFGLTTGTRDTPTIALTDL